MTKFKYKTEGLSCANCSAKIEDILNKTNKFSQININPLTEDITIETIEDKELQDVEKEYLLKVFDDNETGAKIDFSKNLIRNSIIRESNNRNLELKVDGLTCVNCSVKIEKELNDLGKFDQVIVDPLNEKIIIKNKRSISEEELKLVQNSVDHFENGLKVMYIDKQNTIIEEKKNEKEDKELRNKFILFALSLILFASSFLIYGSLKFLVLLFAFFIAGYEVIFSAIRNILKGRIFDENFLMTIASIGAFYLGEIQEAAAIMIFYSLGELLQDLAVKRSKNNIEELLDIKANFANLLTKDGEIKIKPEEINIGDILIVRPGEKVAVDGVLIEGNTTLDMKAINGESIPRDFSVGDYILSGSVNLSSTFKLEAETEFYDSTVGRIMDLVKNSSANKADTEKFISKFARIYTPIVVILALITAFLVPLITGDDISIWIHRSLNFLVISCPCALVLSIPLGFFGGIGLSSKYGILVKGANFLDNLRKVDNFVFDKTGTLTKGSLELDKIYSTKLSENDLLELVMTLEKESPHPIAKSIMKYGRENNLVEKMDLLSNEEIPGKGLEGHFNDFSLYLGNYKLMNDLLIKDKEKNGTILHCAKKYKNGNIEYLGFISFKDSLKEEANDSLKLLKEINKAELTMLTGDNKVSAEKIMNLTSLDHYESDMLPEDKLNFVEKLKEKSRTNNKGLVAFVGDGLNDTPVLNIADIGISMGSIGSDASVESSDIVITDDDLRKIPLAVRISKETYKVIIQNIVMSLGIKIIVLILAFLGIANIYMAIFSDVGVALLAVLNSSRLIFKKLNY